MGHGQKIPIFQPISELFSWQGDRIELISFALSQVSSDSSLDYPQGAFWRQTNSNYFEAKPLLEGHTKYLLRIYHGIENEFDNKDKLITMTLFDGGEILIKSRGIKEGFNKKKTFF